MMPRPKQIVIDKDIFIGVRLDVLCRFAERHFLLLSDTLLYECATATRQVPEQLFCRFESVVKAGAHSCSMSQRFIQWEAWHCEPFPGALADEEMTAGIRDGSIRIGSILGSDMLRRARDGRTYAAQTLLTQFSADLASELHALGRNIHADVAKLPNSLPERLGNWFGRIDGMDIHAMALERFPAGWIRVKGEFCLSRDWMTWQHLRLAVAGVYEHWYRRETGGARDKHAEHDLHDIEYVLLLSRADAIVSKDRYLQALARAAFPEKEKDVFSSLKEVPES
jgi:hypothetical protein